MDETTTATTSFYDSSDFGRALRAFAIHGTESEFLDFILGIPSYIELETLPDLMPLGQISMEMSDRMGPGAAEILLSEPSAHPACPDWDEVRALEHELERPVR